MATIESWRWCVCGKRLEGRPALNCSNLKHQQVYERKYKQCGATINWQPWSRLVDNVSICLTCGQRTISKPINCTEPRHDNCYRLECERSHKTPYPDKWTHDGICLSCGVIYQRPSINCDDPRHLASHEQILMSKIKTTNRRSREYPTDIFLNEKYPDSVLHHLTPRIVMYIPEWMNKSDFIYHNLKTGKGMNEINSVALMYEFGVSFMGIKMTNQPNTILGVV